MEFKNLLPAAKIAGENLLLKTKKHSPTIMVVAGVVGLVGAAVIACKETTKLEDTLVEAEAEIDAVKTGTDEPDKKKLFVAYAKAGAKVAKLYAPSATLGAVSAVSILYGHGILSKRNAALLASYSALESRFDDYRNRVVEKFGNEVEDKLFKGEEEVITEETVTQKNGKEKTIKHKEKVNHIDPNDPNFLLFDEFSPVWNPSNDQNFLTIKSLLCASQDKVNAGGTVFINDIRKALYMKPIPEGQLLGWTKGDTVDFGLWEDLETGTDEAEAKRSFIFGDNKSVLLHFKGIHEVWSSL